MMSVRDEQLSPIMRSFGLFLRAHPEYKGLQSKLDAFRRAAPEYSRHEHRVLEARLRLARRRDRKATRLGMRVIERAS
jgi:hypothetical protein